MVARTKVGKTRMLEMMVRGGRAARANMSGKKGKKRMRVRGTRAARAKVVVFKVTPLEPCLLDH